MKHAPRRRPKVGGYARGDETRAHIIETALQVFGERGFDQAATRDIAAKAGVNPPALQYYFDSKEGLHRACAQHIIDRASRRLQPVITRANAAALQSDKTAALDALGNLLDALTDNLAERSNESWNRFILQSKHDGAGPGVELIKKQLSLPTIDAVAGLLALITGNPKTHEVTRLRTLLVLGQIHWMHAGRDAALKVIGWSTLNELNVAIIKQTVRENTHSMLRDHLGAAAADRIKSVPYR